MILVKINNTKNVVLTATEQGSDLKVEYTVKSNEDLTKATKKVKERYKRLKNEKR